LICDQGWINVGAYDPMCLAKIAHINRDVVLLNCDGSLQT